MSRKKISQLTLITPLSGDRFALIRSNGSGGWITRATTISDLAALLAAPVTSVNGETGVVVLDAGDVGADPEGSAAAVLAAVTTALGLKADLVGGKVPSSQIPNIAVSDFLGDVASEAAMLALVGERGDWCNRTDEGKTYILTDDDGSVLSNWKSTLTPGAPVTSVNGHTGTVVLSKADISLADVVNGLQVLAADLASQAEAEAGTNNTKWMSPLATAQAIRAQALLTSQSVQIGTSYTLVLGDAFKLVTLDNASAIALTIPPNSSVAFDVNTTITILQKGAGQVTVGPGSGVTLQSRGAAYKTAGQYATAVLHKIATDTWIMAGDIST